MTHPNATLLLAVESEPYVIPCDFNEDYNISAPFDEEGCDNGIWHGANGDMNCVVCKGTGTRTVRLVGKVEVETGLRVHGNEILGQMIMTYPDGAFEIFEPIDEFAATDQDSLGGKLIKIIIKAHRSNTLPAELYRRELPDGTIENPDGLREEASDD